jgi:sugar O-acyltransferase (sialic acid O-acetyltransferase NeuD family)
VRGPVHVIGSGGHAKVVIATLRASGYDVAAVWDDDPGRAGAALLGARVSGTTAECPREALAVVAIGSNSARRKVAAQLNLRYATVVHPTAIVHESVALGPGTIVFAGAVIQPDTRIGEHVIVNTAASIDHDCDIGDFAHVAPGVRLAGTVTLGKGAFLGVGSCAVPGARVGDWAVVGAGGVVIHPVEAGVTAVGCPARPIVRGSRA